MNSTYKAAAKSSRDSSRYFGWISLVLLIASLVLFFAKFFVWLGWLFLVIGIYFLVIHLQHRRMASIYSAASVNSLALDELDRFDVSVNEFLEIDIGEPMGVIRVMDFSSGEDGKACYDGMLKKINSEKAEFIVKFSSFVSSSKERFPDWEESLSSIQISHLEIFDNKRCVAVVRFKGVQGEFWCTEYDGDSFSPLIWN
jgi:hypothetical protein